jgi:hypothetical protein
LDIDQLTKCQKKFFCYFETILGDQSPNEPKSMGSPKVPNKGANVE